MKSIMLDALSCDPRPRAAVIVAHPDDETLRCGVAACVAVGRMDLARRRLLALTELVKPWHENEAEWGFNEWIQAQTDRPSGRDWQTWSAAMYLYAAECVEQQCTPFFGAMRGVKAEFSAAEVR